MSTRRTRSLTEADVRRIVRDEINQFNMRLVESLTANELHSVVLQVKEEF
jgi:hypothetical protein